MSKKASKKKVQAKPAVSKFAAPVVDSAREIWLAGLGAVYVAQNESGKLFEQGNKLFDKLVSEGAKLEKKSRNEVETAVDDFVGGMESKVDAFRQQATENWDSLANVFDERVSGTLDRLGVPTTKDLDKLSGNVKKVSRQAAKNWKDLESAFEQRVSGVLDNLHIPGAKDLNKLSDSVQKVSVDATENLGKLSDNVQKASREAVESLEKFENMFEARVTEILGGMGIPTTADTGKLSAELQKLSRQVAAMEKNMKANAKAPAAKATVKKAPAPKTAVKKAPAPKAITTTAASKKVVTTS